jgi:hypothetical protein
MQYRHNGNGTSGLRSINGTSLSQKLRRMTASQKAVVAADIIDGRLMVMGLTRKAVTSLCGSSPNYVSAALRCTPEQRAAIVRGERPLIRPRPRTSAPIDWAKIDDATLVEAVRRIGLERTLDAAIVADR